MIINLILNVLVQAVGVIFSPFPAVTTLPTFGGPDIDALLVSTMGQLNKVLNVFWPVKILMQAFLFLMSYYAGKLVLKLFLGSRVPANT